MKFVNKYQTIGKIYSEPVSDKPSLTDESFKQECDIDFIISNFVQRGIEPPEHQVQYGKQFTSADFEKSLATITECKSAFECLPAIEKEKFNNSVTNFLDFVSNPANLKVSYEKGYIDPQSVNIEDVYPERFKKENYSVDTDVHVSSDKVTGNNAGMPATAGSENPAQSNPVKSAE